VANFLTDGRLALLDALQADATLDQNIRTWNEFGPGLRWRRRLEPASCPVCSVTPLEGGEDQAFNVLRQIPQLLQLELATAGGDAAPCEELVAAAIGVVESERETALGLADSGLQGLSITGLSWKAHPEEDAPRMIWLAALTVRLLWIR
jgi:hypothetical protein